MQVYFWKRAGKGGTKLLQGDPDRWIGPAIVLAQEGHRAVWLSYRSMLYKISPEHIKEATAEETLSQDLVMEEF
jgi:hypothetical protein